jgi:UDP-N-acetylglucosamine diphosphorylase / glucose-1-phosphate thymidylyltransferase / UDP-N-acetylgalactosamine diphosphorylase / glucosamine-1-phosphate N-acetyltransferase / galactosamine-1-phosphate N-acetyltransferase
MQILLDDLSFKQAIYPFGCVRSMAHIRIGILTVFEKWQYFFPGKVFILSENILPENQDDCVTYPANFVPSLNFLKKLSGQQTPEHLATEGKILDYPWQIFEYNDWAIREDFKMITTSRSSAKIHSTNQLLNAENIFLETGVVLRYCMINAENGPVYIGKNADIQEGSLLRGPIAIGEGARVKMGTKIYGSTTIGPHCLAGGEIKNSVLMGYSNKAHDGYLGDSVIAEWCNLGAGTSNSNLKNNASAIKMWSATLNGFVNAGTKCGLLMGDYSRSAINTSFNTGTVVGVCCSIFGDPYPPKFIDHFTWGRERYDFEKALIDINNWKQLKDLEITPGEIESLKQLYK